MRAEGALLVSAVRDGGKTRSVKIVSEKGGIVRLADPFEGGEFRTKAKGVTLSRPDGGMIELKSAPHGVVEFTLQ
jgi:helix-turn-helix protein